VVHQIHADGVMAPGHEGNLQLGAHAIGVDLVNHCVNDILVQGAVPLFFLDYLATGALSPDVAEQIVSGLAQACRANGCALLGGETAEMPGFYAAGEYDVAGFIVGAVEREQLITGRRISPGDVLVAVPSSGLHTNGYSLARRIVFEHMGLTVDAHVPALGETVGEALLRPHRSYLSLMRPLLTAGHIRGMAHITGGGVTDNLPRILPAGTRARVDRTSWEVPPLFRWLGEAGQVPAEDQWRSFNMGMGLILAVAEGDVDAILGVLRSSGEAGARVVGGIEAGDPSVRYA
jgi:phosphoribosylformylglycinamidine cyclo-ligase